MKIVCAWCGKYIGKHEGEESENVSHGICQDCLTRIENEMALDRQSSQDHQDGIDNAEDQPANCIRPSQR